jgi:hypothetical protein
MGTKTMNTAIIAQQQFDLSTRGYYAQLDDLAKIIQTQGYLSQTRNDEEHFNPFAATEPYFFSMAEVQQQLKQIRQEVNEVCNLDDEAESIQESAYDEAIFLLNVLRPFLPLPDIMWLEDGGIGLEWRSKNDKGISTMSIYGDNHVIYGASLDDTRRVKGTFTLNNLAPLTRFLTMLINFHFQYRA